MVYFEVSAPGTLNLFGENVTCEDHNGVMASINWRTTVKFHELPVDTSVIILEFFQFNINYAIHLQQFRNFYERCIFDDTLSEQILEFIISPCVWDNDCQKKIGQTLIYLLAHVTYKENIEIENVKPFKVCLSTQLPDLIFGGFASLAVCFTTCFLHWSHLRSDAQHSLTDDDRAKILMYSKSCDRIFTDCIFKSEVTVSTYGFILRYHCKDSSQNKHLILNNMPKMTILLINSTVHLENTDMTRIKKFIESNYSDIANSILNSIRVISDTAFSVLKKIRDMNEEADTYWQDVSAQEKILFNLIRMQQKSNKIFIKFTEKMNDICEIARRNKLSGKCADFNYARYTYVWYPSGSDLEWSDTRRTQIMLLKSLLVGDYDKDKEINLNSDGLKIE